MNKTAKMPFKEQVLAILALASKNHGIEKISYNNIFYGINYLTEKYPDAFPNIYFRCFVGDFPYNLVLEEVLFRFGFWKGVYLIGYGLKYVALNEEDIKSQYGEEVLSELIKMSKDFYNFIRNEICTQKSVGVVVWEKDKIDKILIIERKKFPFGFAPPAGHVNEGESFEEAAVRELKEETGLEATELLFLREGLKEKNICRRKNGNNGHYWKIYTARYKGELKQNIDETKNIKWYNILELDLLSFRTKDYLEGKIKEEEWEESPGLEVVWYEWFKKMVLI